VRINTDTGVAEVIVPDYQLSLDIGKEGQNARLAARLTGWRVEIKSETQLAEEQAYAGEEWAEGEWVVDPETGEQVWQPAEGGPAVSANEWEHAGAEDADGDAGAAEGADDAEGATDVEAADASEESAAPSEGTDEVSAAIDEAAEASGEADEAADGAPSPEDVGDRTEPTET
jgi:N utilization substance protein A